MLELDTRQLLALAVPRPRRRAEHHLGTTLSLFLLATFYAAMVAAGLVVDLVFSVIGLTRTPADAKMVQAHITLNYTTILDIVFLALAAALLWRFVRTGGLPMLRAMNTHMAGEHAQHGHGPPRDGAS